MLGRRDPQHSLFSAANLPHRVPADSFYGRMAWLICATVAGSAN